MNERRSKEKMRGEEGDGSVKKEDRRGGEVMRRRG